MTYCNLSADTSQDQARTHHSYIFVIIWYGMYLVHFIMKSKKFLSLES